MVAATSSSSSTATDGVDDTLFDRKIEIASEGLRSHYYISLYKIPLKENALTLASYIISMKSEINPSTNYRIDIIEKISRLSIYSGKTLFKDMTREQILDFLDNFRKPEASDPLHKWIGTYNKLNLFLSRLKLSKLHNTGMHGLRNIRIAVLGWTRFYTKITPYGKLFY